MILANYTQENRNTTRTWGLAFTNPLGGFRAPVFANFWSADDGTINSRDYSAFNNGYNTQYAWWPAYKPGRMSSHNALRPAVTFSGSGAMGVNGAGSFASVSSWTAVGQLVVSGVGSFAATASFSGNAIATLSASGAFSAAGSFSAGITAKAWATGQFTPAFSGTGILTAKGSLVGSFPVTTGEALTAEAVAVAVIEAMNAAPPLVDVAKVNGLAVAGSGTEADPWGPE